LWNDKEKEGAKDRKELAANPKVYFEIEILNAKSIERNLNHSSRDSRREGNEKGIFPYDNAPSIATPTFERPYPTATIAGWAFELRWNEYSNLTSPKGFFRRQENFNIQALDCFSLGTGQKGKIAP